MTKIPSASVTQRFFNQVEQLFGLAQDTAPTTGGTPATQPTPSTTAPATTGQPDEITFAPEETQPTTPAPTTPPPATPAPASATPAPAPTASPTAPTVSATAEPEEASDPEAWQPIFKAETAYNWGANGRKDSGIIWQDPRDRFGEFGDFQNKHLALGILTNANSGAVQFRFGGMLNYDKQNGNELTFGSEYEHFTLGPVAELNFREAWKDWTGENFAFLSYFGIGGGLGYGYGDGTLNDGLIHHQDGLAWYINAYLNIFNVSIGKVQIGANFDFRNTLIQGNDGNWPVLDGYGISMDVQPSVKAMEGCGETIIDINEYRARIKKMEGETGQLQEQVRHVYNYLTFIPNSPFSEANIRKTLVLGFVADQFATKDNQAKVHAAVKAAAKAPDFVKAGEIFAKTAGIDGDKVFDAFTSAEEIYPPDYKSFWALTALPDGVNEALEKEIDPENCLEAAEARRKLNEIENAFIARRAELTQQKKRGIHLAGLHFGEEVVRNIQVPQRMLAATVINVGTPSFRTARPNTGDIAEMKRIAESAPKGGYKADISYNKDGTINKVTTDSKIKKIGAVFMIPDFELAKVYKVAQWMKGEERLPGEERARKILSEELKKKGKALKEVTDDEFKAYVKTLNLGIFGHTDSVGPDPMNEALSLRRAEGIKYLLIAFGVSADRIEAKGFGERYPEAPERGGNVALARAKNRRVEFVPFNLDTPITPNRENLPGHQDASKPASSSKPAPASGNQGGSKPPVDMGE